MASTEQEPGSVRPQLPPRPVQSTAESYLTPLARSLRTAGTAALSSNNNLNGSGRTKGGGERRGANLCLAEQSSSPRSQSRQRGVLLPLLQEKDLNILELERKVAALEEAGARDRELKEKLIKEKEELNLKNIALDKNVKNLEIQVEESEEKRFQLEMKNMEMFRALELEQDQVEQLQTEVGRLTTDNPREEEEDLDSLVQTFVEKVSILCRNENLKVKHHSKNVKLKLVTRNVDLGSLENTHLCEESPSKKCISISSEMSSRIEEEETKEVETVKDDEEANPSPVKVKAQKEAEKLQEKLSGDTAGPVKSALANKKLESLKVQTRVRTRSMSKKDPKVK